MVQPNPLDKKLPHQDNSPENFILVHRGNSYYSIHYRPTGDWHVIHDEALYETVINFLLQGGAEVIEGIETFRAKYPPSEGIAGQA